MKKLSFALGCHDLHYYTLNPWQYTTFQLADHPFYHNAIKKVNLIVDNMPLLR